MKEKLSKEEKLRIFSEFFPDGIDMSMFVVDAGDDPFYIDAEMLIIKKIQTKPRKIPFRIILI